MKFCGIQSHYKDVNLKNLTGNRTGVVCIVGKHADFSFAANEGTPPFIRLTK